MLNAILLIGASLIPSSGLPNDPEPVGKHDWLLKNETIQNLVALANSERQRVGRSAAALNPELCLAAQRHADWMARTGIYRHSGLPYREIIFAGPTSAQAAIRGWIFSPAHYAIMLSGSECGFGYMKRGGRTYWVGLYR